MTTNKLSHADACIEDAVYGTCRHATETRETAALPQPQVVCSECGQVTFGCIMRDGQRYCFPCATKGADLG